MRISRTWSLSLLWAILWFPCGCAEKKVSPSPATAAPAGNSNQKDFNSEPPHEETTNVNDAKKEEVPAGVATDSKSNIHEPSVSLESGPREKSITENSRSRPGDPVLAVVDPANSFPEAAYVPSEVVCLVVANPKQFFDGPIGAVLREFGLQQQIPRVGEILSQAKLDPVNIQRVTIGLDQAFVNSSAREMGLKAPEPVVAGVAGEFMRLRKSLKEIGLAFHNYHDTFARFPRADGSADGERKGLSWRVHLLPFLDQGQLYNRFNLNEPWDSDHNKPLIEQMPAVFKTPGVAEAGKTSFHVFTGENTLFVGEQGPGIRDITDETSNTILAIIAGAGKAEIWTKPGGLDVDLAAPKKSIGEVKDDYYLTLMSDGRVIDLATSTDDTTLANMIQPRDGHPVNFDSDRRNSPMPVLPLIILTLTIDADRDQIVEAGLQESTEETLGGQSFHHNKTLAVWFPDNRTIVAGPVESVKSAIRTKLSDNKTSSPLANQLHLAADLTVAIDVASQSALIGQVVRKYPGMLPMNNIKTMTAAISVTGQDGTPFVEISAKALDGRVAAGLSSIVSTAVTQAQQVIQQQPLPANANSSDKEMNGILKELASSASVTNEDDMIRFKIPIPQSFTRIPVLLKPTLAALRTTEQRMIKP